LVGKALVLGHDPVGVRRTITASVDVLGLDGPDRTKRAVANLTIVIVGVAGELAKITTKERGIAREASGDCSGLVVAGIVKHPLPDGDGFFYSCEGGHERSSW
jgi:hypothetical protein